MNRDRLIMVIAAVVVIAAVGVVAWQWRPVNSEDFPDGTFWMCRNKQCNAEFVLTIRELGKYYEDKRNAGQSPACPKCGKRETIRAERCPNCKKFYPQPREVIPCPHCKFKPA